MKTKKELKVVYFVRRLINAVTYAKNENRKAENVYSQFFSLAFSRTGLKSEKMSGHLNAHIL